MFRWQPGLLPPEEVAETPDGSDDGSAEVLSRVPAMIMLSIGAAAEVIPLVVSAVVEVAMNSAGSNSRYLSVAHTE